MWDNKIGSLEVEWDGAGYGFFASGGSVFLEAPYCRPLKPEDSSRRSSDFSVFDLRQRSLTKDKDFLSPRTRFFLTIFQLFRHMNCQNIEIYGNFG